MRQSILVVFVVVAASALFGCTSQDAPGHVAKIGGVIEVTYEAGPAAWRADTERTCGTKLASQPDSLAPGRVWYAEPRSGEAELLACLRARPHVLSVALPR